MDRKLEALAAAIGNVDAVYLEEALEFKNVRTRRRRAVRLPKLSAACAALLAVFGLAVTAFAVSRLPLSWRDIFSPEQTVIGDADETPVISRQPAAATEELQISVEKVISDERTLYLLYSVKANEEAVLDQKGQFADFELYFPGQMMSGAYVSYFLERKAGVAENELEGVVYANWQPGGSANGLVMTFANWQEKRWFDHEKIDFNVAEMVENAGENAKLPQCQQRFRNGTVRYYWQPGDADVQLPCGASICNAGWEDGTFGGMWPLTRKRSPIWSCTGAERRSPPPCCRETGGSRWRAHPSPLKVKCWRRTFPSPWAARRSRRSGSSAPSCPWRCISPTMWIPPPASSARSKRLTRTASLSPAIGALSRIRPTTAA